VRIAVRVGMTLTLVVTAGLVYAGDAAFKTPPTAARVGTQVRITFAVAAPTDVEVAIVNAKGEVIRHLVAGALGGTSQPPEPLKPGLSQAVEWDGKDDLGKPAAGGPFTVRVRAGMRPGLDGFLLENPASSGPIASLAIGPAGSLYVFHKDATRAHWGSQKIKILNRDGTHQRAIMPFSADMAPERLKPLGVFRTEQGDLVPRIHDLLRLNFYSGYRDPFWRSPAQCPVVDSRGRVHWLVMGPAVASLDADGGVPYESLVGPRLLPDIKGLTMASQWFYGHSRPGLALSSDEKHLYFAGLTPGNPDHKEPIKSVPCVFRVPLDKRGPAEVFLGKLDATDTKTSSPLPRREGAGGGLRLASGEMADPSPQPSPRGGEGVLAAPRGLAVAGGLIYVADHDADRVAVFSEKDRSFAGEIKVKAPDSLGVDPTTGAVYVCSVADPITPILIKFENYRTGKELYSLALPRYRYAKERIPHRIAVDASARPVRIWVPTIPYTQHLLLCIEDAGDKFVAKGDPRSPEPWAEGPRDLSYDRVRGELYVKSHIQKWYRIDEKTGKVAFEFRPAGISHRPEFGTQLVAGPDGNLYTYSWSGKEAGLRLYERDGKPTNWPGQASNHIPLPGVMNYMQRTLIVRNLEELFIIPPGNWRTASGGGGVKDGTTCLNVYGMDGKVRRTLIWQCLKGAIPKMDRQGNIYLAEMVKPLGRSFPKFFDGKIEPPRVQTGRNDDRFYYSYMYGSIIKFPPTGGAIWYSKELGPYVEGKPPAELLAKPKVKVRFHRGYRTKDQAELQGALWYRFGFAPYTATYSSCYRTCMCEGGGFDVDPYGRVFYPNLGQFRVEVLDTNGNPITTFGKYGNQDSRGKGSPVPRPDIPLAWPLTVAVSDTHAYVADTLNRRVVKVKLGWAVEETCEVK